MRRSTVLLLGMMILAMAFLHEATGAAEAGVARPAGEGGVRALPAAPALDHDCVLFGNFFDGRLQQNVNNTGARARIGYVGNVLVPICNPGVGGVLSGSSSWAMMAEGACAPWGYFQAGYMRTNGQNEDGFQFDPQSAYYFKQSTNCDGSGLETGWSIASPGIWSTSHCYTVTFSGLRQRWHAEVEPPPCGGSDFIVVWSSPASLTDINANRVLYFGEVFDYLQAPGANGHNSDSMCGFSYNKCTWQQTQRRDLAGVWRDAATTGFFTPGGHCGYGQVVNNPTSFAIWTNFSGC